MARAEVDAWGIAEAAPRDADGQIDWALYKQEYERLLAERQSRLARDAKTSWRAMDGWGKIQSHEDWLEEVRRADDSLDNGSFLIERLGAERYLDPTLMAVLLALRRRLIDEHGVTTASELMMVDLAVLSYFHSIKINGWIGDASQWLESEFFGKDGLSVDVQGQSKTSWDVKIRGLTIETIVERLAEKLMPLLDRSNRMMLRNLKALRERRQPPTANVSIGAAGQVNVAMNQHSATASQAEKP